MNGRAYLLGRMPDADAEQFEARLLDDDETFEMLRSIEDDLLDDYARGRLTADDRPRLVQRYGNQPARLQFAAALAQRTAARRGRLLGFPLRYALPLAA